MIEKSANGNFSENRNNGKLPSAAGSVQNGSGERTNKKDQSAGMWIRQKNTRRLQMEQKRNRRRQRATINIRRRNGSSGAAACNHSPMLSSLGFRSYLGT